ncbi:MAG TPA: hypothetical protein VIE40_02745 [Dehalococcoidia bacterium]
MSENVVTTPPKHRSRAVGCLIWLVGVTLVVTGIVVAIGFAFDQGTPAQSTTYDAGPAKEFQAGVVIPVSAEHMFITKLQDGSFVAVYDKSPRQQELRGDCRVDYEPTAPLGNVNELPGFTGGFVEQCGSGARTVWLADGSFAFGAGYPGVNLDRYNTHVDANGDLIVDMSSRSCTTSRGALGVAPFDVHRCGTGG